MKLEMVETLNIPHKSECESADMGVKMRRGGKDAGLMESN
jgi:hypothetical protein